ncbi:unnamed protein product [Candidula unifasciata]|uniref:AIG1-type G domain-containing protein n=1 Tax=Candidula unifasciata TaxID=100452 RepID=A0A8S3ZFL8_9EUPU|nr:unnamed protein product [Candidula unifasciata]
MSEVGLLLVGRDGNGKSSVGNSILNKKAFIPRSSSFQGSDDLTQASEVVDGRQVTVVDGISLRDNCTDGPENVSVTISLARKAVEMFVFGFTALLLVLKYGVRFTNQEKQAIRIIKSLFGDDVLKKYGVIVMSYGDSFATDVEDDGTTFDDWCRQQTGDVKDLFKECGNRYVLFNNREQNNDRKQNQIKNLMLKVDEVKSRVPKYTMDSFKAASFGQRKMLAESKLPELEKKTSQVLDSVTKRLRKLDDSFLTAENYISDLQSLKKETNELKAYLQREDGGTNSIGQLLLQISVTEASISAKKERHQRKMEYDELISSSESSTKHDQIRAKTNTKILAIFVFIIALIIFIYFMLPVYKPSVLPSVHNSSPNHNQ